MRKVVILGLALALVLSTAMAFSGIPTQDNYSFTYSGPLSPVYSKEAPDAELHYIQIGNVGGSNYILYYIYADGNLQIYLVNLEDFGEHVRTVTVGNALNIYLGFLTDRVYLIYNVGTSLHILTFSVPGLTQLASASYELSSYLYTYDLMEDVDDDGVQEIILVNWMDQGTQVIQRTVNIVCFSGSDLGILWTVSRTTQTSSMDYLKHLVEVGNFLPAGRQEVLLVLNHVQLTPLSMFLEYFVFSGTGNQLAHGTVDGVILSTSYTIVDIDGDGVQELGGMGGYMTPDYQLHYKYLHMFFTGTVKMLDIPGFGMIITSAVANEETILAQDVNNDGYGEMPIMVYGESTSSLLLIDVQDETVVYQRDFPASNVMATMTAYDANDDGLYDILVYNRQAKLLHMVKYQDGNDLWAYNIDAQQPGYDLSIGVTSNLIFDMFMIDYNGNGIPEFGLEKASGSYTVDLLLVDAGGSFSIVQHFSDVIDPQISDGQMGTFYTSICGADVYGQGGGDLYYMLEEKKTNGPHYYHLGLFSKGSDEPYERFQIYWANQESISPYITPIMVLQDKTVQTVGILLITTKSLYVFTSTGVPEIPF